MRPETRRLPPLCHFRPENLHSVRGCPKKVEKTSSEHTTFEISEHPYRTCGSSVYISIEIACLSIPIPYVYSSLRAECIRKLVRFLPYVIFALKTCILFGAVPKKSKKRQAKTLLLKIRSTPIALAALPADFSIFSVPPLC